MPTNEDAIISGWIDAHGHPELAWKAVVSHAWCKKLDRLDETHWNPPVIIVATGVYRCGVTGPTWICNGEIDPQDVELVPNNFLAPAPLLAAVEVWAGHPGCEVEIKRNHLGRWVARLTKWVSFMPTNSEGRGANLEEALRAALAAAMEAGE